MARSIPPTLSCVNPTASWSLRDTDAGNGFALARYNADGSLDATFGVGGRVTTDVGVGGDTAYALVLQPDGRLVAAGKSSGATSDFALARYLANGSLDASFGTGGRVITDFQADFDSATAVVLQPDGKLIAVGSAVTDTAGVDSLDIALARYNANGSLDGSFGAGGRVTRHLLGGADNARAVVLQPDGKIAVAGFINTRATGEMGLIRFHADGSLDLSFGCGHVTTDFHGSSTQAWAVARQSDGKFVVAGDAGNEVALVRYLADTPPAPICTTAPMALCKGPTQSLTGLLSARDKVVDRGDKLSWSWSKGETTMLAEFGDPLATTDYAVCLYAETLPSAPLLAGLPAPAGGMCGTKPCWSAIGTKGFAYADSKATRCGLKKLSMMAGSSPKITVKVAGESTPLPGFGFSGETLPLRLQLQSELGQCWEAVFSNAGVIKQNILLFKGRAD